MYDREVKGLTTKACQRGLMNFHGQGFGGSPTVDAQTSLYHPSVGFGGTTDTFLTVGEYRSKSLSVVEAHEELSPLEGDHWLRRLIKNPNSADTWFDFSYEVQMYEELCGVYYVWKVPNRWGKPCELWCIPSHWVWPRTGGGKVPDGGARDRMRNRGDTSWEYEPEQQGGDYARYGAQWISVDSPFYDRLIQYYEIRPWGGFGSAGVLRLPPDEVIMGRWKSPINKIDGYSTLAAVAQWIDSEESVSKSRWSQFMNQARPEFWVELGPGYEDPDDDRIARIEAKFLSKFVGELNYGKPIISPAGSKITPLSFSPTEMAYFNSEDQLRDMILSARQVPKTAVGISSEMTYGSLLASLLQLCVYGINPRLTKRGQDFTKHLASEWDEKATGHGWSNGFSEVYGPGEVDDRLEDARVPKYYVTGGYGGSGQSGGRQVRLFYDNCAPTDPSQINADLAVDGQFNGLTPNELRTLRGRKPYMIGGNNPIVNGPTGPMPFPINVADDESIEAIAKAIERLRQAASGQPAQPGGMPGLAGTPGAPGEPGTEGAPGAEGAEEGAGTASQPDLSTLVNQGEREELGGAGGAEGGMARVAEGVNEPNGPPRKRWSFMSRNGKPKYPVMVQAEKVSPGLVDLAKAYLSARAVAPVPVSAAETRPVETPVVEPDADQLRLAERLESLETVAADIRKALTDQTNSRDDAMTEKMSASHAALCEVLKSLRDGLVNSAVDKNHAEMDRRLEALQGSVRLLSEELRRDREQSREQRPLSWTPEQDQLANLCDAAVNSTALKSLDLSLATVESLVQKSLVDKMDSDSGGD